MITGFCGLEQKRTLAVVDFLQNIGDLDNTVMLEVLTRRYYGNKDLTGVRTTEVAGCP